jgi:TolA-binding protein
VLVACLAPLIPSAALAEPTKRALGKPATERRVQSGMDERDRSQLDARSQTAASQPSNELEARHYFRDRPDALGQHARQREKALLEQLLRDREGQVVARRREAIALLDRFIAEEPERAKEMADALLRLSELTWELARAEYLEAFAAWQKLPEKKRARTPPTPDYARAMTLYDRILDKHPDFVRLDLVLYMKAFALLEQGRNDEALQHIRRILSDFPESRFRPDAHMAIAEHIFNTDYDYQAALAEYDRVLRYEESELYDLALFKSAWCLWQLGNKSEAAVRFRRVLDIEGVRAVDTRRKRLRELQSEALEYLIQVFTEDERNRAADVRRFLQEIGGEQHVERVLIRLSTTYYDQARFDRGIEAYSLLLSIDPASKRAPDYQIAIARGHMALDDFPKALAAFAVLARDYAPSSTWATQQPDPETAPEAWVRIERVIREQGLSLHERAQRDKQKAEFAQAADLYRVYLGAFDDQSQSYEISFYLAEILFHRLGQNAEAGDLYLKAAQKNPEGNLTRDALYNALGAYERVREEELTRCKPDAPCSETENDRKFSLAIELYAQLYPNDPDLPEILFRQGKLYYDRRIYDPAVRLFGQLLDRFPTSPFASQAGELVLDSFNRAADYENIEKWARRLKGAPAFKSAEAQKRLDGLILGAMFKLGEQLAEKGEHGRAAAAYLRAAQEFPADPRAAKAYYNAGLEHQRAGQLEAADETYSTLIEKHPGSEEGALGAWNGAQMYESIALFSDAARFYEAYGERFPKAERAPDALYNAVLLRVTARDHRAAIEDGRRFIKRYPKHDALDDVYFLIARAHASAGDHQDAASTYRQFLKRAKNVERRIEAHTRLGLAQQSAGNKQAANAAWDDAVSEARRAKERLGEGRYFAAQARYLQGDLALAEFEAIRIEGDLRGLATRLKQKAKLLQTAASIYADVVEFKEAEWVTAALYQIGRSYELFAGALANAPLPEGLNEEEQQVYRDELAMFVVPIEERALEAYAGGYEKARGLGIYNRWTVLMREGLTRMNEVEYPPIREIGGEETTAIPLPESPVIEGLRRKPDAPAKASTKPRAAARPKPRGAGAKGGRR